MKSGSVIIFPTDTVYGIAARLEDREALKKIFEIKKRPKNKPLPILLPDIVSIIKLATYSMRDIQIMKVFWPGMLTIVLNTTSEFKRKTGYETVALRIPNHQLTLDILKEYGPLWTTSVNESGKKPLNNVLEIKEKYSGVAYKIYEEYDTIKSAKASTVVDLTKRKPKILREGKIKLEEIKEVLRKYEKDLY